MMMGTSVPRETELADLVRSDVQPNFNDCPKDIKDEQASSFL
jgi:hypothetical protein